VTQHAERTVPSMHFHRDLVRLHGGDLKVWHYFSHVASSGRFDPAVYFTQRSMLDGTNPWIGSDAPLLPVWAPSAAGALFLAGIDWRYVPDDCAVPVMNLLQSTRHADPADERYRFLGVGRFVSRSARRSPRRLLRTLS